METFRFFPTALRAVGRAYGPPSKHWPFGPIPCLPDQISLILYCPLGRGSVDSDPGMAGRIVVLLLQSANLPKVMFAANLPFGGVAPSVENNYFYPPEKSKPFLRKIEFAANLPIGGVFHAKKKKCPNSRAIRFYNKKVCFPLSKFRLGAL
jgi:hypothetical protein